MADIAASDVSHSILEREVDSSCKKKVIANVSFGDGLLTYPAGGIPLSKAKLGLPTVVEALDLFSPASSNGFVYKYDAANVKVRIYQGDYSEALDGPLTEVASGSFAPAATTLRVDARGW